MEKIILCSLLGLLLAFSSCSNSPDKVIEAEDNSYGIELVNDQKWKVNGEMLVHIRNMEADILNASSQDNPDLEELGRTLDQHVELLISSCTMKGKAHDELHKWLLPFINNLKALKETTDTETKQQVFKTIADSMNEFNNYFE